MNGQTRLYVDQYGQTYVANSVRELQRKLGGRVGKMYVDRKDGTTLHIGYVVGRLWLTAFQRVELAA